MSNKRVIAVDSQMLETIQLCARRYNYNFVRHIQPLAPKKYLERGILVHSILAEYYRNGKDMTLAISKSWDESAKLELDGAEIEVIHANLRDYDTHYKYDDWQPVEIEGKLLIERFAAKILHENENFVFIYQGVIDFGICLRGMPLEAGFCEVDHKTASRKGSLLDLSNQFVGYCWLMNCQRLIKNEIGFQKSLPPKERFVRHLLSYEQSRIDEWVENSIRWIKELVFHTEAEDWPMNWSSCTKFDGCIYSEICCSTADFREQKISRDYKIGEVWDVGRRL